MKPHRSPIAIALVCAITLLSSSIALAVEVVVIGDSAAYGGNLEHPSGRFGYVDFLANWHGGHGVHNRAIPGTTASQWSNQEFVNGQLAGTQPDFVVIQVGGNDLQGYIQNDGIFTWAEMVDLFHRLNAVYTAVRRARSRAKLVVVNYYDLTDQKFLPDGLSLGYGGLPSGYVRKLFHSVPLANWVISVAAGAHGARVVDIYQPFLHHGYGKYLGDTQAQSPMYFPDLVNGLVSFDVHPGTEGHKRIAQLLDPILFP